MIKKSELSVMEWHKILKSNPEKTIKELIQKGLNLNVSDRYGNTLLHEVARLKKGIALTEFLVQSGANVNATNKAGWTPLHVAVANSTYGQAKFLLDNGADVNAKIETHEDDTALHLTTWKDDVKMARLLLRYGADINIYGEEGTPLQTAQRSGAWKVATAIQSRQKEGIDRSISPVLKMKMDMQKKAEAFDHQVMQAVLSGTGVNTKDGNGETLLHQAIGKGTIRLVKFLVEHGADVNAKDNQDWTPLHKAIAHRDSAINPNEPYDMAKFLLDKGADINARIQGQDRPVHLAAWFDDTRLMRLMVERGADLYDNYGEHGTPLQTAYYFRKMKTALFLENHCHRQKIRDLKKVERYERSRRVTSQRQSRRMIGLDRQR